MGNALCGAGGAPKVSGDAAAAPSKGGSRKVVPAAAPAAPTAKDEIEEALCGARAELDLGGLRRVEAEYELGNVIGHGAFCKVLSCTRRSSGEVFAVKAVAKAHDNLKQREGIVKEVAIMRMLSAHPNVVQLQAVFEDDDSFYLVMEQCSGGELFDQIVTRRNFSERDAAAIMLPLLDFIAFAHSKHIVHRDLKPENILLTSTEPSAQLKVIDFGTSEFCRPGQRLRHKFGTPYYVAPEVLAKDYGPPADTWSAGVIMFILLSGYPPFAGSNDARILQRVHRGVFSFAAKEWEAVTDAAKDMIRDMLVLDEGHRVSAAALLKHPWFNADLAAHAARNAANAAALGGHIVRRLRGFAKLSHMKRLALKVMARTLTDKDVSRLRTLFMSMDKDNDGTISPEDLQQALAQVGAVVGADEAAELFRVSDLSSAQGGAIEYEEFIAAMLDSQRMAQHLDAVRTSFETLDRDGDGFISVEDLAQVLQEEQPVLKSPAGRRRSLQLALQLVQEVDTDNDGSVSYEDFRRMWLVPEPVAV